VPVPLSVTVWGLPMALSAIETNPFRLPVTAVKVTLIMQLAPGASVELQVLLSSKFAVAVILAMLSAAVPEFFTVVDRDWLVVLTTSVPNASVVCDKEALADPLSIDPPPQALNRHNPQKTSQERFFIILRSLQVEV
jgi:hypothetical protein